MPEVDKGSFSPIPEIVDPAHRVQVSWVFPPFGEQEDRPDFMWSTTAVPVYLVNPRNESISDSHRVVADD